MTSPGTNPKALSPTASAQAIEFVNSVLQPQPRVAVFDCDGTLWSGDAGEGFFDWELKRRVVSDDMAQWALTRYAEYKAGKVSEDAMCGEMVQIHKGLKESEVLRLSAEFFEENFAQRIFEEMRQLIAELQKSGCDVWAVSSTNEWTIREAMKHFGIAPEKILAASVQVKDGI